VGLVLMAVLAFATVAWADNVQDDVDATTGSKTITAGGSTTVSYRIVANSGDGQAGCNASDGSAATVTINVPSGVTVDTNTATPANENTLVFTSCSTFQPAQFTSSTVGSYDITVSVTDTGVGTYNTSPAKWTLIVTAPTPPADTTPPTLHLPSDITAEATGPTGAVVSFSATADDADPANPAVDCQPPSGSTFPLGATTVQCSATDAAGNTANGSFTVTVRDTTPPTLNLPADITEEATGPSGAAVSYSASASDIVDGSMAADCTPSSGATFPLGTTTVSCSATDAAGNTANGSFTVTVRDTTPPSLNLPGNMNATASSNTQAAVTYSATATDLVDGAVPVNCSPASGSSFPVGPTTVNCSATDAAGNTANGSFTVTVTYSFTGFFQPIDNNGVYNVAKDGSGIPVKFSLRGNQGLNVVAAGYPKSASIPCNASAPLDQIEATVTAGGSSLSYDAAADQYTYVWKTEKGWGGTCRQLQVKLADGATKTANFNFTR
jgi:hypothetical protein